MNRIRRILSLILALSLVFSMVPGITVEALVAKPEQPGPTASYGRIDWRANPHYPNAQPREFPRQPQAEPDYTSYSDYLSLDEAAAVMRQEMINRSDVIYLNFYLDYSDPRVGQGDFLDVLLDATFEHTGQPKEGDYLYLHYGGCSADYGWDYSGSREYYSTTIYMGYYTTGAQEQELDRAVEALLEELALDGRSEYEKVKAIYDYMAENIRYDYDHLYDWEYELQYTAYAALVNRTAVCQGYANLMYRLLLELGVECRSIVSIEEECHAWNIVRLGDLYYNCDVTWDENVPPQYYNYFLKGNVFFNDHTPDFYYRTEEFLREHPMSETDYDPSNAPSHTHSYTSRVVAPTCTEEGFTQWTCTCGDGYTTDVTPALGHNWNEGLVTTEPTENTPGVRTYTCQRCGDTRTEEIPPTGHTHRYSPVITDPTCTEQGFTTYTCTCGDSFTSDPVPALGHDWDEGVVTREPTEAAAGEKVFTCLRCGCTETEVLPPLEHTHRYSPVVTDPTCTEQGFTTYTCTCGDSFTSDPVPALGHDWDEGVVTREPTEEAEGEKTFTCQRCGDTETEPIPKLAHTHSYSPVVTDPTCTEQGFTTYTCTCGDSFTSDPVPALGHDWDEGVVTREPTEEAEGEKTFTCQRCGDTETEPIPKLAHTHSYSPVITDPTCTEPGFTTYTCRCGDSFTSDPVPALGHDWDEGVVTREPTEEAEGEKTFTCQRCGDTETEPIPKLAHTHSYSPVITDPTCTEPGFTTWTCDCGYEIIDTYTDPLGHSWDDGVVTVQPTEEETGVLTFTCLRCGEEQTQVLPKLDHVHSYTDIVTEPSCTENGYTTHLCHCGESYVDSYTDALGHNWGEWVILSIRTCTTPGERYRLCGRCGIQEDEYLPPWDHQYQETLVEPTCTEPGYTLYTCPCGASYTDNYTDALGHNWDEGTVTLAPTEEQEGQMTYTCLRCGDTYIESIPKTEHTHAYIVEVVEPTCTEQGYTSYYCLCGGGYTTDFTDPLGHSWDEGVIIRQPTQTEPGTIQYTCLRCGVKEYQDAAYPECPFVDVEESAYFYEPVLWALANSITSGVSATEFAPNNNCTRGQVVTFLWRAAGCPEPQSTENPFTDVSDGQYYYKPILWAVESGITQGVGGGRFAPDQQVTRGQFVTFLWRAAGQPEPKEQANAFVDVSNGAYYFSAVLWAAENGITAGTSPSTFAPDAVCSRAQVVTFLFRNSKLTPPQAPSEPGEYDHAAWGAERSPLWQEAVDTDLSTLPRYDSEPAFEDVLAILDAVNPDGALIARLEQEDNFMCWYFGDERLTEALDTAIHECYHGVSHTDWDILTCYLENGWLLSIPETETYKSEEMTVLIPEEYRTLRFETYVGPGATTSSNQIGIYGLLNEFNAYQSGMNHDVSMFDYYCAQPQSNKVWIEYINGCENNVQAYAEFRYYILTYLLYARDNYPEIYDELMANESLRYGFTVVNANFQEDIAQYLADLDRLAGNEIPGLPNMSIDDNYVWFNGQGMGRFISDYWMLMEAMESPEYQQMYEAFLIH